MAQDVQKLDRKIYAILRDCCDAPRLLFISLWPLYLERHGTRKRVLLLATKLYTYLVKYKGYKLYVRWPNRQLLVTTDDGTVVLSYDETRAAAAVAASPPGAQPYSAAVDAEWCGVRLVTDSQLAAGETATQLGLILRAARHNAELMQARERGVADADAGSSEGGSHAGSAASSGGAEEEDSAEEDEDNGGEEGGGEVAAGRGGLPPMLGLLRGAEVRARRERDLTRSASGAARGTLARIPPSRYTAITALVDAEFADYTTLKNAYMRHEEEQLLRDLDVFIRENESQVEALCEHHYPAFIHAAQQCLAISATDAQLVGAELSGATALVRTVVLNLKQVAATLLFSRTTLGHLVQVRALLTRSRTVVEYLEAAEVQVRREQLMAAVLSVRELVRLSTPLAEFALGEYVLQTRVPALVTELVTSAVQHLNAWLRLLRDSARPVGMAALLWQGSVCAGHVTRHLVTTEDGNLWWLQENYREAQLRLAPFAESDLILRICNGAAIQAVFQELRQGAYFAQYYSEGRAQQVKADLLDPAAAATPTAAAGGADGGAGLVEDFVAYCATALGFVLLEDILYNATCPHLQSSAEILKVWDQVAGAIAQRARALSQALLSDANYTTHMLRLFHTLRRLVQYATENTHSVELNPLLLARVVEKMSDHLVSWWLQAAFMECAQYILTDPVVPLVIDSAARFESEVARFSLNRCPLLELPVPAHYPATPSSSPSSAPGPQLRMPFCAWVSQVGASVLHFLEQCYSVLELDSTTAVQQSELNNIDDMLLKYISVLFRTVSESLQGQLMAIPSRSLIQYALFVTSCSAMPVLVTLAEQQFMLHWLGDDGGAAAAQQTGAPRLLQGTAAFFAKPVQAGIERLLLAYRGELEERLQETRSFAYWRAQVEAREAGREASAFAAAMDNALDFVPQLGQILQPTVLRSVVATMLAHAGLLMQSSIEEALNDGYGAAGERDFALLRACLREFELQASGLVPEWQRRLRELLSGLTAATRFPLNIAGTVEDLTLWLQRKEEQYKAEKSAQPQLLSGIEEASKAVAKGLQVVGKTVANPASMFGKKK